MKISEVKALVEEQITIAYRLAYENAARVAEGTGNIFVASAIRALPIPTVTVIRPETAALKPESVTPHTIIAGQGLHPTTDEIIDRARLANAANPLTPSMIKKHGEVILENSRAKFEGRAALMSLPVERAVKETANNNGLEMSAGGDIESFLCP